MKTKTNREMWVFVDRLPWKLRPGQGEERVHTGNDIGELSPEKSTVSIYFQVFECANCLRRGAVEAEG
jgi:hypothetical protein